MTGLESTRLPEPSVEPSLEPIGRERKKRQGEIIFNGPYVD
jgi:hypothetical protein